MMEENKIIAIRLTVEEADAILQYLAAKPFKEVVQLIDIIQKSDKIYSDTDSI